MHYGMAEIVDVKHFIGSFCSILNEDRFFSIIYVLEGSGNVIFNNEVLPINEDEVITLMSDECISIKSENNKDFFVIQIIFRAYDKKLINDLENTPFKQSTAGKIARTIILKILSEYVLKPPLFQYFIHLYLAEIILEIITEDNNIFNEQILRTQFAERINSDLRCMIEFIDKNISDTITVEMLAALIHTTPGTVYKLFKLWLNTTPIQYINTVRINRAKELLIFTDLSITEIAEKVGFNTIHYFSRYFRERERISPSEFKEKYGRKNLLYTRE